MRKLSTIALVSCLTLGATAAMAAQTATSGTATQTTKAMKTTTTTTTKVKPGHTSGALTAMDPTAKTITVKDTYTVTDTTKITAKGKAITMADLHVGDTVSVTYTKNGDKWDATRVIVTKAAKM